MRGHESVEAGSGAGFPVALTGVIAIGALALACAGVGAPATLPTTLHAVDGLHEPAEILVDRWGVSHIYAMNTDDMFFTQGWNAAWWDWRPRSTWSR